jgi:hypothetical protein
MYRQYYRYKYYHHIARISNPLRQPMGFKQFPEHKSRVANDLDADLPAAFRVFVEFPYHIPVEPIHSGNVAAIGAAMFRGDLLEFPDKFLAHRPHPWVFRAFKVPSAKKTRNHGNAPGQRPAYAARPADPAPKSPQGLDYFFINNPEFLLPNCKYCLASMKPLPEKIDCLIFHFLRTHNTSICQKVFQSLRIPGDFILSKLYCPQWISLS